MRILWGTLRTPLEDLEETFMKALDILQNHEAYGPEVVVEIYVETDTDAMTADRDTVTSAPERSPLGHPSSTKEG